MSAHIYHVHLDSLIVRLEHIDNLLGKDVEIIVRERAVAVASNFDALNQLVSTQADPTFFNQIENPVNWQQQLRDEWE